MKKLLMAPTALLAMVASNAMADIQHLDDVIISFSLCVGNDCVNGESFGFDTLRLKENNVRIHFQDTSNSASFPTNDWRILANDTSNGGANYLAIEDSSAGRVPFRVEAGARANALVVEADGDVGIGTLNPAVDLEIVTGNTPTIRLQQDGSSGFTPQTYDIAANEANFFIRDVTNGSKLTFRMQPGAPEDSIYVAADGDVGFGTSAPEWAHHISRSGTVIQQAQSSSNGAVQYRMKTDSANRRFMGIDGSGSTQSQVVFGDSEIKLAGSTDTTNLYARFNSTGLFVNGSISTAADGEVHPDYVFEADYKLMPLDELKSFVNSNKHLPEIPSADDVAANGYNMTEMQIKLLKKVEELTLYTIRQQEVIDELLAERE